MRISTLQIHNQGAQAIIDRQRESSRTQLQLGTGHKLVSPSDDPVGSARLLTVQEQIATNEQYQRNITLANSRLGLEENALQGTGDLLQRAHELAVAGNNAPLSDADRGSIAQEVRQLLAQLQDLANSRDSNGEFIFSGFKTQTQPFTGAADGNVSYRGDQGQRLLQVGLQQTIAVGDPGDDVFQRIRTGNGKFQVATTATNTGSGTVAVGSVIDPTVFQAHNYRIQFTAADQYDVIDDTTGTPVLAGQTYSDGQAISFSGIETAVSGAPAAGDSFTIQPSANQDLFTTLGNLATALEAPTATVAQRAQVHQAMANSLADLDQGLDHVLEVRGRVGARLNVLQSQEQNNEDFNLRLEKILNDVDGLDYAEASTNLNQELLALQAAQQSFVRINSLSLFNYLR